MVALAVVSVIAVAAIRYNGSTATAATAPDGKAIFESKCSACPKSSGTGVPGTFPALAGNTDVNAKDPSAIIATVEHGKNAMPSFKASLSPADIAAVLTYVRSAWGNHASPVAAKDVTAVK